MEAFEEITQRAAQLERGGDWDSAAFLYAEAYHDSMVHKDVAQALAALLKQAWVRWQQGAYEQSEELAQLSCTVAECHGNLELAARAINVIAAAHYARRDLPEAAVLYRQARALACDAGRDELVGFTTQNLGVIANILGDLSEARSLYLESIGCTARSGDRQTAMMAYNNLAMVCADLRDWMEAEVYFDRGIEIAEQLGHLPMLAKLRANRAEPLIHTGQIPEARKTLDEAERLARSIREVGTLADATRFRAMIARKQDDLNAAKQYIADSLRLASDAGLDLERAEALEERACLLDAEGRTTEAFSTLQEAQAGYQALGAERDAARTQEMLESWSHRKSITSSPLTEATR